MTNVAVLKRFLDSVLSAATKKGKIPEVCTEKAKVRRTSVEVDLFSLKF